MRSDTRQKLLEPARPVTVWLLRAKGPARPVELPTDESLVETLQEAVGGCFQALPLHDPLTFEPVGTLWFHEDGKLIPLPANIEATQLARQYEALFEGDYIAGDAVLSGPPDETGDITPYPEELLA